MLAKPEVLSYPKATCMSRKMDRNKKKKPLPTRALFPWQVKSATTALAGDA
jgi:hypothetical protein